MTSIRLRARLVGAVFLAIASVLMPVSVPGGLGDATRASAASCVSTTTYSYGDTYSDYAGGVDGVRATFDTNTNTPYLCNQAVEHTVESLAMFLQNNGYAEIGETEGDTGGANYQCLCPNQRWFYTYTAPGNNDTSYLDVFNTVSGTEHEHSITLSVSCNPNCNLYANYQTDATHWPSILLSPGENPAYEIVANGEVYGDTADQMDGTFTDLEYHAGNWYSWSNVSATIQNNPYCDVVSGSGSTLESQNFGPTVHWPTQC